MAISCPFCHRDLGPETEPDACPACGLSLDRLQGRLGEPPAFDHCLLDPLELLQPEGAGQVRKTLARIESLNRRYSVSVAVLEVPADYPLSTIGFWLANGATLKAGLPGELLEALLLLDPDRGGAAWTLGYGLEPWLEPAELQATLTAASEAWRAGAWADGLVAALSAFGDLLDRTALRFDLEASEGGDY